MEKRGEGKQKLTGKGMEENMREDIERRNESEKRKELHAKLEREEIKQRENRRG